MRGIWVLIFGELGKKDNNPIGRFVTAVVVCMLALCGGVILLVENSHREGAQQGFAKGELAVVAVYEENQQAENKLMDALAVPMGKPRTSLQEEDGLREVYDAAPVKVAGLPSPAFLQKYNGKRSLIYAIFSAPNADDKLRTWAKDNGYPDWNFSLNWENLNTYNTEEVAFNKPGSRATIVAFFESNGRLYLWDGSKVHDCSAGITSHAGGKKGEKQYRQYVQWLAGLGK